MPLLDEDFFFADNEVFLNLPAEKNVWDENIELQDVGLHEIGFRVAEKADGMALIVIRDLWLLGNMKADT